jgi:hypothetical protein
MPRREMIPTFISGEGWGSLKRSGSIKFRFNPPNLIQVTDLVSHGYEAHSAWFCQACCFQVRRTKQEKESALEGKCGESNEL